MGLWSESNDSSIGETREPFKESQATNVEGLELGILGVGSICVHAEMSTGPRG